MFLIFDTETTGLPKKWKAPITDTDNWPRCVQIAWQLHDELGELIDHQDYLVLPDGYNIPYDVEQIHGISTQLAQKKGQSLDSVLELFNEAISKTKFIVGQNVKFDLNVIGCEFVRANIETKLHDLPVLDTCTEKSANLCQLPGGRGGKFKFPTLTELHQHLFNSPFADAHNATADVEATARCFFELIRKRVFSVNQLDVSDDFFVKYDAKNPSTIGVIGLKHQNLKKESQKLKKASQEKAVKTTTSEENIGVLKDVSFSHLHCHSQFSVLQSTTSAANLVNTAVANKMPAIAMTDIGNLMGAFYFVKEGLALNRKSEEHNKMVELAKKAKTKIDAGEKPDDEFDKDNKKITVDLSFADKKLQIPFKPIVGCEFNVCENHLDKSHKDNGYRVVFLAKNKNGYDNLSKMSSISHTKGFYYVPRIDRQIVEKYKEDLIVLSGNLDGEIPNKILNIGETQAEEALIWWKNQFGDDFYLEIMRHNQENENHVNDVLIEFSKNHNVELVATNNTFYTTEEEAKPHDILLCVKDGEKIETPKGRGRGFRYGLPNDEYYLKSQEQMKSLFKDIPEAIINTQKIVDKVEVYDLARKVLLPKFVIPQEFEIQKDKEDGGVRGENSYLKHLTYKGAEKRYGEDLDEATKERLDFELSVIEKTGYPGYFLIVWDLILEARKMGVSVGPGRGSAAGSAVAYCLEITNIDPIEYDLLFERFLNPDRVSLPDIDIDFDDEGRQKVMDFVINKYGSEKVAQIITYGTMAAKSSIRDTARALDLPLYEADKIAKLIPNIKLQHIFGEDEKSKGKVKELRPDAKENVSKLRKISKGDDLKSETIKQARNLEGSVRNLGTHACGVIITPTKITDLVPIATAKDSEMYVTQFDNNVVESAGLLKMDFLGLKTLTLIKDTVKIIKAIHGKELIPDDFPLDDKKTFKLFQRGETVGIFQYESPGMQKHLKALKPTEFADLIAMNALYRPGPMEYIPSFIKRKHGQEEISYSLPEMEESLKETYGVTVYQEQVMLLSQKIANFSKGDADQLRKAMGKKIISLLNELKPKFIQGGKFNKHPEEILEKIWNDWEKFASYAFNKSHSTCYAYIGYQTAYLKAHYPSEYMAAVLSNNMKDIKQITFFMNECKRAEIPVLGPDINESYFKFAVNKEGAIRFGMGAIKGVGEGAVKTIVNERKKSGNFSSIFDLVKRIDLRSANKKAFDSLVMAGAFDSFKKTHRAQYFQLDDKGITIIEKALKYGNRVQESRNSAQVSLFGDLADDQFTEPIIPETEKWGTMEELSKEKEVVGIYITANPLDDFSAEINYFCNTNLSSIDGLITAKNRDISVGGIISNVEHKVSKNGKGYGIFSVEDFSGSYEFKIFGEEYLRFKHFLVLNSFVHIKVLYRDSWNGETKLVFNNIQSLQDVFDDYSRKITVNFPLNKIDDPTIKNLNDIFSEYKGQKQLFITVYDVEEKIKLTMLSRKIKVNITSELIKKLNEEKIKFKLNE